MKYKLINRMKQSLNILLSDGAGKLRTWTIPPRSTRTISAGEMSQDVADKVSSGYLKVEEVKG